VKIDCYYCQWDAGKERCRKVRRTRVRIKMLRTTGIRPDEGIDFDCMTPGLVEEKRIAVVEGMRC